MTKSKKTAEAPKEEREDKATEVAVQEEKSQVAVKEEQFDDGLLDNDSDIIKLPRVEIMQPISEAVVSGDAKQGTICNSITKEVIAEPVFTPLFVRQNFISWRPRTEGGGMIYKTDDPNDERVVEDIKWGPGGEKPRCTRYLNFLVLFKGEDLPIILSFHDTGYQEGRNLYTMMKTEKLKGRRTFDVSYSLSTKLTKNDSGSFFVPHVKREGPTNEETRNTAAGMFKEFSSQNFTFDAERQQSDTNKEPESEF
jgi:hypothetical protein